MSYADKFARKADEIKGRAKAALGEALDDDELREQGRAELAHARASRTDHTPGQASDQPIGDPGSTAPNTRGTAPSDAPATPIGATDHSRPDATSPDTATRDASLTRDSTASINPSRASDPSPEATSSPKPDQAAHAGPEQTPPLTEPAPAPAPAQQAVAAPERLLPDARRHDYIARWSALKGEFVDDPRQTIAQADRLVAEVLNELAAVFAEQRRQLEVGLNSDQATTEDLRVAFRRYRAFFDRLLSL